MSELLNEIKVGIKLIAEEMAESSSSDDLEEMELAAQILKGRKRKVAVRDFVEKTVADYSDQEFKNHFRLQKCTAYRLIESFESSDFYSCRSHPGGSKQISAEKCVLSFLWFCGNKTTTREVCNLFDMSYASFDNICSMVMKFLLHIGKDVIKMPHTPNDKQQIANDFEKISGFKGVIGCIDGSYIPIRTPAGKIKSTYVNRHDMPSLTLQGICNSKCQFLDVFTGISSKIHDSRVFNLSFVSKNIPTICGDEYYLLGDAAYPIRPYLITPYKDYGNLTESHRVFNQKLSTTRVKIENSFGILKQRFRQLIRLDFKSVRKASLFILSCCVLHNFCIESNDSWEYNVNENNENEHLSENQHDVSHDEQQRHLKTLGEMKRSDLKQMLTTERENRK